MRPIDPTVFAARVEELWSRRAEDNMIATRLQPHFVSFDPETPSITISFPVLPWELNINNVVNGGISATMLDAVMGTLA